MKTIFFVTCFSLFSICSSIAKTDFPNYYIVSHGFEDAIVVTVHGWVDNKKPCESLVKYMNESMEKEGNYHSFSCVGEADAKKIERDLNNLTNW